MTATATETKFKLKKISEYIYELPREGQMLVPARIYGNQEVIAPLMHGESEEWSSLKQLYNVACLPGIQKYSLAMPDVHPGYGFPIGGIGAFDTETGVINVAGVGFDVNCGVRTLKTTLSRDDIEKDKLKLADALFRIIPAGLGSTGELKLTKDQIDEVLVKGAEFCVENGYGFKDDLEFIEENGRIKNAEPSNVSDTAKHRQFKQVGTLGSGNHYLEVQYVDEIYDEKAAKTFGLKQNQVLVSIHCGSRALGHQIGTDYLKILEEASRKYKIPINDKELVSAPFSSPEGQRYYTAMNCGINCAFANRQALAHLTRTAFNQVLGTGEKEIKTLYEVGHNTAKVEKHMVDGKEKSLIVHRKGATRAFGPGRKEVPDAYSAIGQPVIVGGTMGTASFILHGTARGMDETFGSACHGAGRIMSRNQAKRNFWGDSLVKELGQKGMIIKGHSKAGIAEEAPGAYKDVEEIINIMHNADIARKVVRLRPLISIKG